MCDHHADRNLLFGILAHQLDFLDRDNLLEAMHLWVRDKSQPLDELLVEKGWLTNERHQILDAVVQEHLRLHDDDPAESLAALGSVPDTCINLRELQDESIQRSLSRIGDPELMTVPPQTIHRPASRFRKMRIHDEGGLGRVWVAEDKELHREVALKEIRPEKADHRAYRHRFIMEAEVTGGLEHPGIVPVYSLESYADGRPYYAMQLIRGTSLRTVIRRYHESPWTRRTRSQQKLELRRLLARFRDVCHTVAYAHSRGILHRDLKPANVMLGDYGETFVVDWGLARAWHAKDETFAEESYDVPLKPASASSVDPTVLGTAVGSPPFMSPEQARGEHDQLGPQTDVFGLGATLYMLLTGQAPAAGATTAEVLSNVKSGNWAPPRTLNKFVPRPLDAICAKAMALRPDDRYPTATLLGEEIESFLNDDRVDAHRERWGEKFDRFGRRHNGVVRALFYSTLLLLGVVAMSAGLLALERVRTSWMLGQVASYIENPDQERQAEDWVQLMQRVGLWELVGGLLGLDSLVDTSLRVLQTHVDDDASVESLEELVDWCRTEFGEQNIFTFELTDQLVEALEKDDRWDAAVQILERSLPWRREYFGVDHDFTLRTMRDLARCYAGCDRIGDALSVVKLVETLGMAKHQEILDRATRRQLELIAARYQRANRFGEAIAAYQELLDHLPRESSKKWPAAREVGVREEKLREQIAWLHFEAGQLVEAEAACRHLLDQREADRPNDRVSTPVLIVLSDVLLAQGKTTEAKARIEECREQLPDNAYVQSMFAAVLTDEREFAAADELLERAYDRLHERYQQRRWYDYLNGGSRELRNLIRVGQRRVELYEAWGNDAKASSWHQQLDQLLQMIIPPGLATLNDAS